VPRVLNFSYASKAFGCSLHKLDRNKLYGSVDLETQDIDGNACKLATLASDGRTLIPSGGTAFGYISADGEWLERTELKPVNLDGESLETLPSSFDEAIELDATASLDSFLEHGIRLSYLLHPQSTLDKQLLESLTDGTIYQFPFLYRAGVSPDPAFMLTDDDQNLWMLVGETGAVRFTGLDQASAFATDEDDDGEDDFSFDML